MSAGTPTRASYLPVTEIASRIDEEAARQRRASGFQPWRRMLDEFTHLTEDALKLSHRPGYEVAKWPVREIAALQRLLSQMTLGKDASPRCQRKDCKGKGLRQAHTGALCAYCQLPFASKGAFS